MALSDYHIFKNKILVIVLFLVINIFSQPVFAQNENSNTHHDENEEGHVHHDHINEIGISTGYVYLDADDDSALGLHFHFMRHLHGESITKYFGLGVGVETIFADHLHSNLMGSIAVYPYRSLVITLSPGVLFVEHDEEMESRYSTHLEAVYGFTLGEYEVGPFIGISQSGDDRHYAIGIHLGIGL